MEGVLIQSQISAINKLGNVVIDIDGLTQPAEKCYFGSPKVTKALSRKSSCRMEKRGEEQEVDEVPTKLVVKVVPSQMELLKQPLVSSKALVASSTPTNNPSHVDTGDGRINKFNRLPTVHPRKIVLFFATMSSIGTMVLIYFTLAINRRGGG